MPRKAPKEVVEHRITFGNYERERLNELQNSISFAQYASPLKSNVLSVALVGAGAYTALAYALEWWPFEPESSAWWSNNPLFDFNEAKKDCQLSAYVIDQYENRIIPEHHEKMAKMQAWLDANPTPSGPTNILISTTYKARIQLKDKTLENINEQYQKSLGIANKSDEQCELRKAKEATK